MSTDRPSFLARWSRLKHAAERAAVPPEKAGAAEAEAPANVGPANAAAPASAPEAVREAATPTEIPLPPIESLDGLRSDYQAFFQQPVDEDLRHAALKKLFADPHFNQMDMLDVYVDDYTQFEPLPAELRLRLPSARSFLLESERAAVEAAEAGEGDAVNSAMPSPGAGHAAFAASGVGDLASGAARDGTPVDSTSAPSAAGCTAPAASTANQPSGQASAPAAGPDLAAGSDSSSS
jgi:hypothetical protein